MRRVGINGFGRMGRLTARIIHDNPSFNLEVVHINEVKGTAECAAHLLKFDSIHGTWKKETSHTEENKQPYVIIDGKRVLYTQHTNITDIDWSIANVDVVVECSGKWKTRKQLEVHLRGSASKVVVSCPTKPKEGILNVVMGVNDNQYNSNTMDIVTAASCTTNCIAPAIKVLKSTLGIEKAFITTIHDITNTQVVIDKATSDLRRARSSATSLIPTTTGSAVAITYIYPELKGKIDGLAVRVPIQNSSLTDCVFMTSKRTTKEEVNALMKEASTSYMQGVLGYEERALVSVDYKTDPRSCIVDSLSTNVVDGNMVKVLLWYDNEWGYCTRMVELAAKVASSINTVKLSKL